MPLPPYKRPGRGQPPSSTSVGRLMGDVERLSDLTGTGDIGVGDGAGGRQIYDARPKRIPARITSHVADNAYGFVRVDDGMGGDFPDLNETTEEGDGESLVAWELNGRDDVAVDTLVQLEPCLLGPGYVFEAGSPTCCGWGADYHTVLTAVRAPGGVIGSLVGAVDGVVQFMILRPTMIRVPANSGRVMLRGQLSAAWAANGGGGGSWVAATKYHTVSSYAGLYMTTAAGVSLGALSTSQPLIDGGQNLTGGVIFNRYPTGLFGPVTIAPVILSNGLFFGTVHQNASIPNYDHDTYWAWGMGKWEYNSGGGTAGMLAAADCGRGPTWLTWEKVCCETDPVPLPPPPAVFGAESDVGDAEPPKDSPSLADDGFSLMGGGFLKTTTGKHTEE